MEKTADVAICLALFLSLSHANTYSFVFPPVPSFCIVLYCKLFTHSGGGCHGDAAFAEAQVFLFGFHIFYILKCKRDHLIPDSSQCLFISDIKSPRYVYMSRGERTSCYSCASSIVVLLSHKFQHCRTHACVPSVNITLNTHTKKCEEGL